MHTSNTLKLRTRFRHLASAITLTAVGALPAHADNPPDNFEMKVVGDAAYGQLIQNGNSEAAIARLDGITTRKAGAFFKANNLCVAYTKTGELSKAEPACEQALELISADGRIAASEKRMQRDFRAMALSNLGVLRALGGEYSLARDHFTQALELETRLSAPATNMAYLELKAAQAVSRR